MTGETNLQTLLQNMKPELQVGEFVFCTLDPVAASGLPVSPIGQFLEEEGMTLILPKAEAKTNALECSSPCRMITLKVHSSLDAVGFLAVITKKLADEGVSVNAVSAYFHDHLFVPTTGADQAMRVLNEIIKASQQRTS